MENRQIIVERATKTVYRDGDVIVKQFVPGYAKSAVLKEAFNHALAEEAGLSVPELLGVKDTGEGWALFIRRIEGRTMAQAMAEEPGKLESYMEQFVQIQSGIHKATCRQMGRLKDKLNAQIQSFVNALGDAEQSKKNFVFQGQRLVLVHLPDVAALDVVSLVRKETEATEEAK